MLNELKTPHTLHSFDQELEAIRNQVMAMGGLAEQQLKDALTALMEGNGELAETVIANDHQLNRMEVKIDKDCTVLLARRTPVALDLRMVISVAKTTNDLERIGDETKEVARTALRFSEKANDPIYSARVGDMGRRVERMLRKGLDALARLDARVAGELREDDLKVDGDHNALLQQMSAFMMKDPRDIPDVMQLCWAVRALERIGDRCRNIGEYIVYLVEGEDIRHGTDSADGGGGEGDKG